MYLFIYFSANKNHTLGFVIIIIDFLPSMLPSFPLLQVLVVPGYTPGLLNAD